MIREFHHEIRMLYETHHNWLIGWLTRRTKSQNDAQDLAQDTFLRIISNPQKLTKTDQPRALLSTIAHGLMIDQIRRSEIEQAYLESIAHLSNNELESTEYRLIIIESIMRVDALFDGLNENVKIVFLMSRLEGFTHVEIAEYLGVSLRTVEGHMALAIRHLIANA